MQITSKKYTIKASKEELVLLAVALSDALKARAKTYNTSKRIFIKDQSKSIEMIKDISERLGSDHYECLIGHIGSIFDDGGDNE